MRSWTLIVCLLATGLSPPPAKEDWRQAIAHSMKSELEGNYLEARAILTRALEEARLDSRDPVRAGTVLWRLAWVCFALGDYDEAGIRYRASLVQLEKALGTSHPALATVMGGYASLLEARSHFRAAERMRLRALGIVEDALGPEHPDAFTLRSDLARGHYARRDYARAETALRKVLADWPPDNAALDARLSQVWSCLGYVLHATSRPAEAIGAFRRSLVITQRVAETGHPIHLDARYGLALSLFALGQAGEAAQMLEELSTHADRSLGTAHPLSLKVLEARGRVLKHLGSKAQARELEREIASRGRNAPRVPSSVSFAELASGK